MAADASLEIPDESIVYQGGPIEHWSREPDLGLRQRVNLLLRSLLPNLLLLGSSLGLLFWCGARLLNLHHLFAL